MDRGIIDAFHRTSRLTREDLFDDHRLMPLRALNDAGTPAAGWVGARWQSGSTVLIGINPGGGGGAYRGNPTDDRLYGALRAFRDSDTDVEKSRLFCAASRTWSEIQHGHSIWRLISPLLEALGNEVDEIAFLNILPFRTRKDAPAPLKVLQKAWSRATAPQVAALNLSRIVALGKKAHNVLLRLAAINGPEIILLKRTIGDSYLSPEAKLVLAELEARRRAARLDAGLGSA